MKKLLLIFFGILILAFLAFAATWYFFNNLTDKPIIKPENQGISKALQSFFPEGTPKPFTDNSTTSEQGMINIDTASSTVVTSIPVSAKFQQISKKAISGASNVGTNSSTSTLWYMDKSTGHIFSVNYGTGEEQQITNTTLPAVAEIFWGRNGTGPVFLLRYLKDSVLENMLARIKFSDDGGQIEGTVVNTKINSFAVSPKQDKYFYISSNLDGSKGFIGSFSGAKETEVFSSTHPNWVASWPEENTISLVSSPSSQTNGFAFSYNLKNRVLTKIISEKEGLTTLFSPDGQKLLYSSALGGHNLKLFSIKGGGEVSLNISTLPEKCVWTRTSGRIYCGVPNGKLNDMPDSWYKGHVSFTDNIWEIDPVTGAANLIYNPSKGLKPVTIDAINLFLAPKNDKLFMTNKIDGTLWMLDLSDSFNRASTT